jgi:hypothetical protein
MQHLLMKEDNLKFHLGKKTMGDGDKIANSVKEGSDFSDI